MSKTTKKELNERLSAEDYAYVPDPKKPSTWKLRIDDVHHVGGAIAALGKGFRGEKVVIPQKDLPAVKRKILAAWHKFHGRDEEPPTVLTNAVPKTGAYEASSAAHKATQSLSSDAGATGKRSSAIAMRAAQLSNPKSAARYHGIAAAYHQGMSSHLGRSGMKQEAAEHASAAELHRTAAGLHQSLLTNEASMYTRNCACTTLSAEQLDHHKKRVHKKLREADIHPKDKKKIHDKIEDAEDKDDIDDADDHIDDAEEYHKKHGKPLPDDEMSNNPNPTENRRTMTTNASDDGLSFNAKHPRHMSDDELHASHKLHVAELNKRAIDRDMGLDGTGATGRSPGNMHSFDQSVVDEDPLESMHPTDLEDIDWDDEFLGEGGPRVPADGLGGISGTQVDETHGAAGLFGPAVPSHNNLTGNAAIDERNWFAAIPPRYQEVIRNAAEIENRERGVLLQRLTANMTEENRFKAIKRWGNMPLTELREMITMFAANAQSVNPQPPDLTPIFLGGAGGAFQVLTSNEQMGADAVLPLPVMNLKEEQG